MAVNKSENPEFLNDYLMYLKIIKGNADRTVTAYFEDIRLFLRYLLTVKTDLHNNIDFDNIVIKDFDFNIVKSVGLQDIYDYMFFLSEERENSSFARARKLSALRSFFKYFHKTAGLIDTNPMSDVEIPMSSRKGRVLPKFLTLDESLRLLENVKTTDTTRDYCIVTLFLNCGMRLSELVNLNKNDVNLTGKTMKLHGKGNKERHIYLNDACVTTLEDYFSERIESDIEPYALFLSKQKKRISKRRVQQIIEDTLANAQLDGKGLSTHKLRHTAATLMYQYGGVDTLILKDILGHESIATTEIYTHVSDIQMKEAMENSPLANIKKDEK